MSAKNDPNTTNNSSGAQNPGGEITTVENKPTNSSGPFELEDLSGSEKQTVDKKIPDKEEPLNPKSAPLQKQEKNLKSPERDPEKLKPASVQVAKTSPQPSETVSGGQGRESKEERWFEKIHRGVGKVHNFYKSDFFVFMAYTTFSAFIGGVFGSLLFVHGPRYIPWGSDTTSQGPSDSTSATTSTPYVDPKGYQDKLTTMNAALDKCLADRDKYNKSITDLTKLVGNVKTKVTTLNTDLTSMTTETRANYTMLTEDVMLKNFVVDSQISELKQVFVSKEWLFIILLMGLFEVAVIGVVWIMWKKLTDSLRQKLRWRSENVAIGRPENVANGRPENVANWWPSHAGGGAIQGDQVVLKKVIPCRLDNRVCVIGFHSETVDKHTRKVKDILSQNEATKNVRIVQFLIKSHDDILQMPGAKLYLVFVDFNERNVILEDPNKGLGDLRLTTIQAIEKMGADAILTYSRDQGSKDLSPGDLYNTDLASIRQHSELRRLDGQQRMLSVFETFSKKQSDHIVKVVKNVVK